MLENENRNGSSSGHLPVGFPPWAAFWTSTASPPSPRTAGPFTLPCADLGTGWQPFLPFPPERPGHKAVEQSPEGNRWESYSQQEHTHPCARAVLPRPPCGLSSLSPPTPPRPFPVQLLLQNRASPGFLASLLCPALPSPASLEPQLFAPKESSRMFPCRKKPDLCFWLLK